MTRESESGLPVEPVYGPEALEGWDPAEKLGAPGEIGRASCRERV